MLIKKNKIKHSAKVKKQVKLVAKKSSVKKTAVKKLVKSMVKKIAAKKQFKKKAVVKSVIKPAAKKVLKTVKAERMITLADLFSDATSKNFSTNRLTLSDILEETLAEVKSEDKSMITLADLFEDVADQKDLEISLADLFEETPAETVVSAQTAEPSSEMVTLSDLFGNFDWDKVVLEAQQEVANQNNIMTESAPEPVKVEPPKSQMFHSVAIPHFWDRPNREPGLLARLFAPQMMATVGVTMISLFFVSLWFQTTKASIVETSLQDPALNGKWEAVMDGYYSIQTQKVQIQNPVTPTQDNSVLLKDAQNSVTQAFGQAIEQKLNQSNGGTK